MAATGTNVGVSRYGGTHFIASCKNQALSAQTMLHAFWFMGGTFKEKMNRNVGWICDANKDGPFSFSTILKAFSLFLKVRKATSCFFILEILDEKHFFCFASLNLLKIAFSNHSDTLRSAGYCYIPAAVNHVWLKSHQFDN